MIAQPRPCFQYARALALFAVLGMVAPVLASPENTARQQSRTSSSPDYANASSASGGTAHERTLDDLEKQVDGLNMKVESELRASGARFEAVAHSTDRAFNVLALLGALGSFLGGLIVFLSWLRGRKGDERQRKDYEREREAYERRALREREFSEARSLDLERRQNESHSLTLEIARSSATREASLGAQQIQLGENVLARSGEMLSRQIDGIEKLGGVIELVKKTFDMQLTRVGDVDKLVARLGQTDEVLSSFTKHFRDQYRHVCDLILTFKDHSRMAWTRLTSHEETIATRALTTFETVPNTVLDTILTEENGKNRYELAWICQLLGVSAFYTNDIDAAVRCLERGLEIYGADDAPPEHLFPQAFCSHFLGLVEKNWCHVDRPQETNLASARRHLEDAARRLQTKDDEFLTPLTLAEILSYSEQTRDAARQELDRNIGRLSSLSKTSGLNGNQTALLGRALLMRGNIEYLCGDLVQALVWYTRAHEHSKDNSFALLSMGQATPNSMATARESTFREGLALLEAPSGPLTKRENTVRLTAIAWGVIASDEVGAGERRDSYARELDAASTYIRPVGGRAPLFFCPTTKVLVFLKQLRDNTMSGTRVATPKA